MCKTWPTPVTDPPMSSLPPNSAPDDGTGPDRETTRSAIVVPKEIWHVARLAVFRQVLKAIEQEAGPSHVVLAKLRESLDADATHEWHAFVSHAARTESQRQAYLAGGEPDHIELDQSEGVPVAAWIHNNPAFADAFGVFQVTPIGSDTTVAAISTNPFRLVDLATLPQGTRTFVITDARHTATAAVHAVLSAVRVDIDAMRLRYLAADAWRALRTHAAMYKALARYSHGNLKPDDFREWRTVRPSVAHFDDVPRYIDEMAGTIRCQQALALSLFADHYVALQESAERAHPSDLAARVNATADGVARAVEFIAVTLAGMNGALLTHAGLTPHEVQAEVIFQTIPRGMPTLIALPIAVVPAASPLRQ